MQNYHQFLESVMSIKGPLMDLIRDNDNPLSFLSAAMDAQLHGKLKLRTRGVANTRELMALYHKVRSRRNNKS